MTRVIGVVAAVAALACSAVVAHGAGGPLSGRIVVSATDAPAAHDLMLVTASGATRDLAPIQVPDAGPAVSPDGSLVAFRRSGALWVVGTSGKGLRRVSPALGMLSTPQAVWAPDSRTLAVIDGASVFRASAQGGVWKRIARGAAGLLAWSPDGTRLAYLTSLAGVDVVTASGKHLLDLIGDAGSWSPAGRLVVRRNSTTWDVYSAAGKRLGSVGATAAAWSAQGALATIKSSGVVEIRPGGTGRPTVTARPVRRGYDLHWAGPAHLLVGGPGANLLFDVTHRKTFLAPAAYNDTAGLARDGSVFGESPFGRLLRSTLSGSTRTVATFSGTCGGKDADPFSDLQALPDGSAAVYESTCAPAHDLFSLAPDGSGTPVRLTATPQDELDPAVSPDGTRLAFARTDTGDCAGCNHQIWITAADGSDAHAVTLPADSTAILQDDRPSFSPDGAKIVFSRWDAAVTGDSARLAEAPATGGTATLLKVSGGDPAWGPSRIAFSAGEVDTIAPDGSGLTSVPNTKLANGGVPAWSGDGRLAILRPAGQFSIYLPATKAVITLPGLRAQLDAAPGLAWSPDGTRLAFTAADANDAGDVWVVDTDGTHLTRVTHGLGADGALAWR